jgi:hypothetical protein
MGSKWEVNGKKKYQQVKRTNNEIYAIHPNG